MLEELQNSLARPPRQSYSLLDIQRQLPHNVQHLTQDLSGLKLSLINHCPGARCVVYLHTHNGSRIEGLSLVGPLVERGECVCLFDFRGYGNSQGQGVTIGIKESQQIAEVLLHLKLKLLLHDFVLWGRSMGAVSAILFLARKPPKGVNIECLILDSAFCSLRRLLVQLVSKKSGLPEFLCKFFIGMAQGSLNKREIYLQKLQLLDSIKHITQSALFVASQHDSFIDHQHTLDLYKNYPNSQKRLIFIQEDHNKQRGPQSIKRMIECMQSLVGRRRVGRLLLSVDLNQQQDSEKQRKKRVFNAQLQAYKYKRHSQCKSILSSNVF